MPNASDLSTCDREPIHVPGTVQSHGCLIACDAKASRVLRHSASAVEMLGLEGDPIGKSLQDLLGPLPAHDIINAITKCSDPRRPALMRGLPLNDARFDVSCHTHDGMAIVEFERCVGETMDDPLEIARSLIAKTREFSDRKTLFERLPRLLQALLGYDRVMIYEFAADGSGKVVGEAKLSQLESFLGQHFPAADIPKQARALYLRNTTRVIADSSGACSPIVPEHDASGAPLDLSYAHLRSVSSIHLEYLRNMGVAASMSVSIVVGGELWGLIACHHYEPRALPMPQRVAAELFGDFLSLHLTAMSNQQRMDATLRARGTLDRILANITFHESVETFLREQLPAMGEIIACDGVGLWMNGVWTAHGATPPATAIPMLARLVSRSSTSEIWATHALGEREPAAAKFAAEAAGALVVPLSVTQRDYLFFFRREKVQMLEWAGDPNKTYDTGPNGERLTPRKSFAIWKQLVEGQSDAWSEDDRVTAGAALLGFREVIMRQSEVLTAERRKAELRQRVLNDELNHRVKNILALIKSLVAMPASAATGVEEFVDGLRGRILALSHAHDQIILADGGGSLRKLLEAELSPYPAAQIALGGAEVGLDARAYSVMALVLHELATNAAKYGALSSANGRLAVSWKDLDGGIELSWHESGGPAVRPPQRQGFGSVLLNRSIPYDLQGTSDVDFRPEGIVARITIPSNYITEIARPVTPTMSAQNEPTGTNAALSGCTILLVEDQLVIALDAEDMLHDMGCGSLKTVATAADALREIAAAPPDIAVLDVNLGSSNSLAVADELVRRGIPFVFATGYGDSIMIPPSLQHAPIVRKPYSEEALRLALTEALAARSG